ncbi:hypothetical protein [Glycocaulis sp.]|uniref:hypothetical protein n=1 Tax=Glycocaulis sp. TaxID=1969725 RepID=UPI003F72EE52
MSILLALLLAAQTPQASAIAGNYTATSEAGTQCALVLMPPARRPQGAMALMTGAAGLAAVSPECELAIAETMFWQFDEEGGGRLLFVDAAGNTLFAGERASADSPWQGAMTDGARIRLERSR